MKKLSTTVFNWALLLFVLVTTSCVWADLPKPPDSDMASGSKSWLDVGKAQMNKAISISSLALGAIILVSVAAAIVKAYHVSNEKGELGHFFKMLIVGLLVAAIGIGLVYAGYQVVSV